MKRFLLLSLGGLVILGLLSIGTLEYTSKPSFCGSCHIMRPYVDSWATSTHNRVNCTDCHYTPGVRNYFQSKMIGLSMTVQYFTGTEGPTPWADVQDASCLREACHEARLLSGKASYN